MSSFSLDLNGKTAIVTGGTRGIGFELAKALTGAGSDLVLVSRNSQEGQEAAAVLRAQGVRVEHQTADVTSMADMRRVVETTVQEFGRVDIMVNNAGTAMTKMALEVTEEEWDLVLDTNLKSVFFASQAAARVMVGQKKGKIINIASIAGKTVSPAIAPYCASKAGVIQLTRALAIEWARYGINVNAIGPGYMKTSINEKELSDEKVYQSIVNKVPLRRLTTGDDLAGAVIYLASEASNYITGHTLFVDGGWVAQ